MLHHHHHQHDGAARFQAMHELAAWLLQHGSHAEAEALAKAAAEGQAHWHGEAGAATLRSTLLLGQCMLARGNVHAAKKHLCRAIDLAMHAGTPECRSLAASARGALGAFIVRHVGGHELFDGKHQYVRREKYWRGLRLLDAALAMQRAALSEAMQRSIALRGAAPLMATEESHHRHHCHHHQDAAEEGQRRWVQEGSGGLSVAVPRAVPLPVPATPAQPPGAPGAVIEAQLLEMATTMHVLGCALLPFAPGPYLPFSLSQHTPHGLLMEALGVRQALLGALHPEALAVRYAHAHAAASLPALHHAAHRQLGPSHPAAVAVAAYHAAWCAQQADWDAAGQLADVVLHAEVHGGMIAELAPGLLTALDELAHQLTAACRLGSAAGPPAHVATRLQGKAHALAVQIYGAAHPEAMRWVEGRPQQRQERGQPSLMPAARLHKGLQHMTIEVQLNGMRLNATVFPAA